jgi:hypothetical protein
MGIPAVEDVLAAWLVTPRLVGQARRAAVGVVSRLRWVVMPANRMNRDEF